MYGPGALLANRYRLDERVGGGGMGEVWRATDTVLGRTVAVKVMRPELLEEPGFAERFLFEARAMATIKHPGVVTVHDYQGDASGAFLVMEYVEGEALSRRLHRFGKLDPARTMHLIAQAADALQAAHDKGVVHRDIKPGNLLVTADDRLVLTDFGIARSAASTPLTATGAVIGTPSYLAPEQVLGKPATPASDVYALGVVAYECLTGRRPFDGDNPFDIAMKRLREPPPTMTGDIPIAVLAVVERTLAAEPAQRWPSASALAAAARKAVSQSAAGASTDGGSTDRAAGAEPVSGSGSGDPASGAGGSASGAGDPVGSAEDPGGGPASPAPATAEPGAAGSSAAGKAAVFTPARVPVPKPAPPLPPTVIEHRSPVPPTTPPPATPYPPASPYPPRTLLPPPQPPGRPRPPATLVVACLLLTGAALALLVYSAATGSALGDLDRIAEQEYGYSYERDYRGTLLGSGWVLVGTGALLALLFLLCAVLNVRGSRAARAWTFVLGSLTLFCCGPCWLFPIIGWRNADPSTVDAEFVLRLRDELGGYGATATRLVVIAVLALIVAMVLLMVPPTNRYFRLFRPGPMYYYHPYYPYYPYPPRR